MSIKAETQKSIRKANYESVTQDPSEYVSRERIFVVSLVDCPGVADTGGIEKDIINTVKIAERYLSTIWDKFERNLTPKIQLLIPTFFLPLEPQPPDYSNLIDYLPPWAG